MFLKQEKWKANIAFVVGNRTEDIPHISVLSSVVASGIRKLFSVVSKEDLYAQVTIVTVSALNYAYNLGHFWQPKWQSASNSVQTELKLIKATNKQQKASNFLLDWHKCVEENLHLSNY